ncbi:hypothetical protein [Prosthecobacter fluviatilis]|uniref:Uncharacterized protein n=1 Tax=Prosthecobacter fluviatilis TaxID=445931 RepID=A0ABW0KPQ5_9BACT
MNRIFLLIFLCLCCSHARAQYVTNLTLLKNQFLTGEPVVAVVSVTNRSGGDVIVGGHGARDWLQFEITQSTGQRLAPVTIGSEEAITLPAGGTTKHTVEISGGYSTASLGTFTILANVLHPLSGQFFMSNKVRMTITDSKPNMFDQPFGVPQGFPNAGRQRRYQVILFRELDDLQLYCRLTDDRSGAYIATFLLGPAMMAVQPQISIDVHNKLHVLFLAMPHVFCHVVVNPDGKIHQRTYYRDPEGNRPSLVMTNSGAAVIGGQSFDPGAPPPAKKAIRKASERPSVMGTLPKAKK